LTPENEAALLKRARELRRDIDSLANELIRNALLGLSTELNEELDRTLRELGEKLNHP
jgi:hypothetical protein